MTASTDLGPDLFHITQKCPSSRAGPCIALAFGGRGLIAEPRVKHKKESVDGQLVAHASSRVVTRQKRIDRLERTILVLPCIMLGTGTDVTAFRLEDPLDLLLRDSIGGTAVMTCTSQPAR